MGLRKSDIDLNEATVSIERSVVEIAASWSSRSQPVIRKLHVLPPHGGWHAAQDHDH
jgi:hypothetical protein